jgi:GT2 family glycosyltransferase
MTELSIVILTFNTKEITLKCLKSIFDKKWEVKFDVWVVDNNSSDQTLEAVKKSFPQVITHQNNENGGFAKGNNVVLRMIKTPYVLILNSDTELLPESLDNLIAFARKEDLDITSCKLVNPDGSFQPNAGHFPTFLPLFLWLSNLDDFFKTDSYQERNKRYYQDGPVDWVGGTAMLINTGVFEKIGFLDEKIFMYGEDVDFCWRAKKAGLKVGWTQRAQIMHIGGASSKSPRVRQWRGEFRGLVYLYKKNYGIFSAFLLKILIYIFVIARIIAFAIVGKLGYSKAYAKVFITL